MVKRLEAQVKQSKADISRFPADKFLDRDGDELILAVKVADAALAMEDGLEPPDGYGDLTLVQDYVAALKEYRALKEKK